MRQYASHLRARGIAVVLAAGCGMAAPAMAQQASGEARTVVSTGNPNRDTLLRMQTPITIEFNEVRLDAVIQHFVDVTGAEIEPQWKTDTEPTGLDPEAVVKMKINGQPALVALERVLTAVQDEFTENAWQLSAYGSLECGPKDRLNRTKRVEIYDINDLLFVLPIYDKAPELDLQSVLQQSQSGGGGGGQSPFEENDQNNDNENQDPEKRKERAKEIQDLLVKFVEPSQWTDNGGEAGTIQYYDGHLIIQAPDYMHRQINGYPYWPSTTTKVVSGRRYVSLNLDTSFSKVNQIDSFPVTGVVAGGATGGGGGGNPPPPPPGGGG